MRPPALFDRAVRGIAAAIAALCLAVTASGCSTNASASPRTVELATVAVAPQPATCAVSRDRGEQDYQSFPVVTRTRDGSVVAAWRASAGHQTATASLLISTLLDPSGGCTWSKPRVIATEEDPQYTLSIGGISQNAAGDLVVPIVRYRVLSPSSAREFRSYVTSSADGKSWTQLRAVDAGFPGQSYPSSVVTLGDGTLLMSLYGTDDPQTYSGWYARFVASTDGGATWTPRGGGIRGESGRAWTEPSLLVENDRILAALRFDSTTPAEPSGTFIADSTDGGITWNAPRRATSGTSGHPALAKLDDGRYFLPYRDVASPTGAFRYGTSTDLVTWQLGQDVTDGSPRRMLYAGLASLGTGRSVVVYSLENPDGDTQGTAEVYAATI